MEPQNYVKIPIPVDDDATNQTLACIRFPTFAIKFLEINPIKEIKLFPYYDALVPVLIAYKQDFCRDGVWDFQNICPPSLERVTMYMEDEQKKPAQDLYAYSRTSECIDRIMGLKPHRLLTFPPNTNMTTENNDRPPLTSISTNGTYRLKLIKPKFEKVKVWEDGTCSARLFFVDDKGFCLSKNFSTKYGKALAMLVGKFSGKFTSEIRLDATPAEYLQYLEPACGQTLLVGVECEANGEYNGKAQYKYKLSYPKGSQKPVIPDALPNPEDVPY